MANLPPATYTTFAELAEYARQRAKHSAARNGHQEFAYWCAVIEWAEQGARLNCDPHKEFVMHYHALFGPKSYRPDRSTLSVYAEVQGTFYWKAVHLRQMLINRGEKPPRLSLKWLRDAAEKL